jgi:RimJ/RimL family protein N-acetyltransferase
VLRGPRDGDLDGWARIHADLEVVRWIGRDRPLARADSWRELAYLVGHWGLRGFGQWLLEERATGELVGRAGLYFPEGWPGLEVGWTLARPRWGRGLATEAGRASIDWAFSELGADRVISLIDPTNHRSRRVAERLGATREGRTTVRGHEVDVYAINRPAPPGSTGACRRGAQLDR